MLDSSDRGRVVLAGDAIKYVKETLICRCDMGFDAPETGAATIKRIIDMADRIVPGHFPELIKTDGVLSWEEPGELPLLGR